MKRTHRISRLLSPLAVLALAAAGIFAGATAASAHDELVGSDPAAGSTLAGLPAALTLSFSAELLAGQGGNQIEVTDAAGASLADGAPEVTGTTLVQPLVGTPTGQITVLWRVVSSDGHPISGDFSFTVAPAPVPTVTQVVTATPQPAPATPSAAPAPIETGSSALPWFIVGAIVIAALIVVVIVLATRGRRGRTPSDGGPGTGTER